MKMKCIGTGYISSNITKSEIKNANDEIVETCCFQFANFKYKDKYGKKYYSKFLCIGMGKIAKFINDNFIKNHKVFITGEIEDKTIIRKDFKYDSKLTEKENNKKKYANVFIITISHIEYMGNMKDEEEKYDKDNIINDSIDEIIKNVDVNEMDKDINDEAIA